MDIFFYISMWAAGAALLVWLVWRLASSRHALPCPVWLRWMVELDNPFTKTNRAAVIIRHLGLQPGMAVLDVGCGPGRLSIPLALAVGEHGKVAAMDIQDGMIRRTREKAEAQGIENIRFIQAAIGEGTLEANLFDRVLLVTVLGEIPDRRAALEEIFSVLKPGGLLSVTEVIFDPHFQRRGTVKSLAEATGFQTAAFFGHALAYTMHFRKPKTAATV